MRAEVDGIAGNEISLAARAPTSDRRLLQQGDPHAAIRQRQGARQAGEPGANDRDFAVGIATGIWHLATLARMPTVAIPHRNQRAQIRLHDGAAHKTG